MICFNISAKRSWKSCLSSSISLCVYFPPHTNVPVHHPPVEKEQPLNIQCNSDRKQFLWVGFWLLSFPFFHTWVTSSSIHHRDLHTI